MKRLLLVWLLVLAGCGEGSDAVVTLTNGREAKHSGCWEEETGFLSIGKTGVLSCWGPGATYGVGVWVSLHHVPSKHD